MHARSRVPTIMRNLLLAVCAFAIMLGVVEVVLRTTHLFGARVSWTQPDPWIGWRHTPGRAYWFFQENDHAIQGRINAMGWRDRERTRTKPAGTTRVAVIGDSYVEGLQVELDSTFVAIAERLANARGAGHYEFMNFGRSGAGPMEEYIVLERDVLACNPDIVVFLFTPSNDIAGMNPATTETLLRPFGSFDAADSLRIDNSFRNSKAFRIREYMNPFKQHSALVSLVAERYNAGRVAAGAASFRGAREHALTGERSLMTAHADSVFAVNYALSKQVLANAARVCTSRGVAFMLMSVPIVYDDEQVASLRAIDASFDAMFFDRDLAAMADSTGTAFVPLTEAFLTRRRATGQPLYWAHWNYPGHRLVGESLATAVAQFGTPPLISE